MKNGTNTTVDEKERTQMDPTLYFPLSLDKLQLPDVSYFPLLRSLMLLFLN